MSERPSDDDTALQRTTRELLDILNGPHAWRLGPDDRRALTDLLSELEELLGPQRPPCGGAAA